MAIDKGKIIDICSCFEPRDDDTVIDAKGYYLVPGFIDIHVHGGGGVSVSSGSVNDIIQMANAHALNGTTTIVPTTYSLPKERLQKTAQHIIQAQKSQNCLGTIAGIHFEGPYLSPYQTGAQDKCSLLNPSIDSPEWMLDFVPYIRMIGMAPELPDAQKWGAIFADKGIVVSIAHSNADYLCVEQAVESGFSDVTHIYSSCSTIRRKNAFRISGVVEAGLEMSSLSVQAIGDGCHLPQELLRLIFRCKGAERMYLVTDGLEVSATDICEGTVYKQSNGIDTICEDGVLKLLDRSAFAGSISTTTRMLKNVVHAGIPFVDCVRMLTDTPARRISLESKGRIEKGFDADLLILDRNLDIVFIMANGHVIKNALSVEDRYEQKV